MFILAIIREEQTSQVNPILMGAILRARKNFNFYALGNKVGIEYSLNCGGLKTKKQCYKLAKEICSSADDHIARFEIYHGVGKCTSFSCVKVLFKESL